MRAAGAAEAGIESSVQRIADVRDTSRRTEIPK